MIILSNRWPNEISLQKNDQSEKNCGHLLSLLTRVRLPLPAPGLVHVGRPRSTATTHLGGFSHKQLRLDATKQRNLAHASDSEVTTTGSRREKSNASCSTTPTHSGYVVKNTKNGTSRSLHLRRDRLLVELYSQLVLHHHSPRQMTTSTRESWVGCSVGWCQSGCI